MAETGIPTAGDVARRLDAEVGASSGAGSVGSGARYQNPIVVGVVLLFAGISVAMIQYKVPTIMPALMGMFSMTAESASWLMSIFTLMSIFMALPSGALAQRFGARTMMVVACGVAIAGSLIGAFAQMEAALICSRAIEGVALTVLTTCGPIVVQQVVRPDKIGTAMGIWGIWGCLGSTVAAVVTPTIFESLGFQGLWFAFAAVAAVAAVVVVAVIKKPQPTGAVVQPADAAQLADATGQLASSSANGQPAQPVPTAGKPRYRELCTPSIALFFVGFVIFNICLLAILAFVPTILQMQGFDPTLSGFISTAPMLLSIISSPAFGAIADRTGRCKPLLVAGMLVMGPCTFLLYTQTGALLWAGVALMGLVGMGAVAMFLTAYSKLLPRPELASIGMGVLVLFQGLGQFLGTFFVQMLLGPALDNWLGAGLVLMALGLIGTGFLLACKIR